MAARPRTERWIALAIALTTVLAVVALFVGPTPPAPGIAERANEALAWRSGSPDVEFVRGAVTADGIFVRAAARFDDPAVALRALGALGVAALVFAFALFLRALGRPLWLAAAAPPLAWGAFNTGIVSLPLGLALTFAAGAVIARPPGPRAAPWLLGLCGVAAAIVAPQTVPILVGVAATLALARARRRTDLLTLFALVPALSIWLGWRAFEAPTSFPGVEVSERLRGFFAYALDLTSYKTDGTTLVAIVGTWLGILAISGVTPSARTTLRARLERHSLLLVALGLCLGLFLLPWGSDQRHLTAQLMIAPLALILLALPRPPARSVFTFAAACILVGTSLWFHARLVQHAARHGQLDARPLLASLDALNLPPGFRATCLDLDDQRLFHRTSSDQTCRAVLTSQGAAAPWLHGLDPTGLVRAKTSHRMLTKKDLDDVKALDDLDLLLVRGKHKPPRKSRAKLVAATQGEVPKSPFWSIYRVVGTADRDTTFEDARGGTGGKELRWNCPDGMALSGLTATTNRGKTAIVSVQPRCRTLVRKSGLVTYRGRTVVGPVFGGSKGLTRRTLLCRKGHLVSGAIGKTAKVASAIRLACNRVELAEADTIVVTKAENTPVVGSSTGTPFELRCPSDSVATGLRGRHGAAVDSIGVACGPLVPLVTAPTPKKTGPPPTSEPKAGAPTQRTPARPAPSARPKRQQR